MRQRGHEEKYAVNLVHDYSSDGTLPSHVWNFMWVSESCFSRLIHMKTTLFPSLLLHFCSCWRGFYLVICIFISQMNLLGDFVNEPFSSSFSLSLSLTLSLSLSLALALFHFPNHTLSIRNSCFVGEKYSFQKFFDLKKKNHRHDDFSKTE